MKKGRPMQINIAAKNLGTARYRKQVVRNRKVYNRKDKHPKRED